MSRRNPAPGEFYRHFKGNTYQIKGIARNSESNELMVVYQAMYPPFGLWVRPLDMFMQEADRDKYPDCTQKYRFEKITDMEEDVYSNANDKINSVQSNSSITFSQQKNSNDNNIEKFQRSTDKSTKLEISDEEFIEALISGQTDRKLKDKIPDSEIGQRGFMALLDAETYREKYIIFQSLRDYLDERLLNNIAVSLDIVLTEEDEDSQYDTILKWLQTYEQYECKRLR